MSEEPAEGGEFMEQVGALCARQPELTLIQAAILIAAQHQIASDSRSLSNKLGLAHALILREIDGLLASGELRLVRRDARTMRTFYALHDAI